MQWLTATFLMILKPSNCLAVSQSYTCSHSMLHISVCLVNSFLIDNFPEKYQFWLYFITENLLQHYTGGLSHCNKVRKGKKAYKYLN